MKDQYVADIGDYGKYALLKAFCDAGERVGVNWYYTENDGTEQGKFTGYLQKPDEYRPFSPELFDALKDIFETGRSIEAVKKADILQDCCYFGIKMGFDGSPAEREWKRGEWFAASMLDLDPAELIYLDPDNGLLNNDRAKRRMVAVKYALPEEVEAYYEAGKNVVYYCHKGRRKLDSWEEYKKRMIVEEGCSDAKQIVLTYHKGTQRSYVFLIHPKDYVRYRQIIDEFLKKWSEAFEEE